MTARRDFYNGNHVQFIGDGPLQGARGVVQGKRPRADVYLVKFEGYEPSTWVGVDLLASIDRRPAGNEAGHVRP